MATTGVELDDTEEQIIQFISNQPGSFAGTPEVAEELDMTTNGASYRLKQLRDKTEIESRQPSRDEIWFLPRTGGHSRGFNPDSNENQNKFVVGGVVGIILSPITFPLVALVATLSKSSGVLDPYNVRVIEDARERKWYKRVIYGVNVLSFVVLGFGLFAAATRSWTAALVAVLWLCLIWLIVGLEASYFNQPRFELGVSTKDSTAEVGYNPA